MKVVCMSMGIDTFSRLRLIWFLKYIHVPVMTDLFGETKIFLLKVESFGIVDRNKMERSDPCSLQGVKMTSDVSDGKRNGQCCNTKSNGRKKTTFE